jgi:hypothetical protein
MRGRKSLTVRRPKEMDPMSLNGGTPGRVYILEVCGQKPAVISEVDIHGA